jgi:hypothetical protein
MHLSSSSSQFYRLFEDKISSAVSIGIAVHGPFPAEIAVSDGATPHIDLNDRIAKMILDHHIFV